MAKFSQQLIDEQYKKLPQELKDAIFSVDIADKIFEIGRKFAITIEKNGFLAEETAFVVLGLLKPEEFTATIKNRLILGDDEAQEIAKEVNRQILLPIREALKRAHQIEIPEEKGVSQESRPPEIIPRAQPAQVIVPAKPVEAIIPKISPEVVSPIKVSITENHFWGKGEVRPVPEQKVVVPPPEKKELEPIPPPAKPKIAPIDLRQGPKPRLVPPQFMSGTIFVPPLKRTEPEKIIPTTEPKITKGFSEIPKAQEKKPVIKSFDPYRETAE